MEGSRNMLFIADIPAERASRTSPLKSRFVEWRSAEGITWVLACGSHEAFEIDQNTWVLASAVCQFGNKYPLTLHSCCGSEPAALFP